MNLTKKKTLMAIGLELLGAVLLAVIVFSVYNSVAIDRQENNSDYKLQIIQEQMKGLKDSRAEVTKEFDDQYQAKADTLALMLRTDDAFQANRQNLKAQAELLKVDKVQLINGKSKSSNRNYRYYQSKVDGNRNVLVTVSAERLQQELEEMASVSTVLDGMHVGQNGFAFAVDKEGRFAYYPDEELMGAKISKAGLKAEELKSGKEGYLKFDGASYYCSTEKIGDYTVVCAVPKSELRRSARMTVIIALIVYLVLASFLVILYVLARREEDLLAANGAESESQGKYNGKLGKKIVLYGIIGLVASFGIAYCMQSLMSLSTQSVTNERRVTEAVETVERSAKAAQKLTDEYNEDYLERAAQAAFMLGRLDQQTLTQSYMIQLADSLKLDSVEYFDKDGNIIATDTELWNYSISNDPKDQSYEFRSILEGNTLSVAQEPQINETDGVVKQYSGMVVTGENHKIKGMVQVVAEPERLAEKISSAQMENVLPGIQTGNNGFAFAVNAKNHRFDYYPDENLIGQKATACGIEAQQLMPGYSDFIKIKGKEYYATCRESDGELIYVAVPKGPVNKLSLPMALVITLFTLLWLIAFWRFAAFADPEAEKAHREALRESFVKKTGDEAEEQAPELVEVTLANGKKVKAKAASDRWSHRTVSWHSKTLEQKLGSIARNIFTLLAIGILLVMINADRIFAEDSIIHYVLRGTWEKGLNIFAITDCCIVIISVLAVSALVRRGIMYLADYLNARGETICRLLDNFIKFAVVIGLLYYCLNLLGVDVKTLVASAGILALIVGLGANSLVSDILAGLFIVFEEEFQVGDIVTIDGFRGTVVEIGIRTTKVKEAGGNVKVFSNRNLSSVLNMTKDYSYVSCVMSVEYGEDLVYVEKVLSRELGNIAKKLPEIKDGPYYRGVSALGDNSVDLTVVAKCTEEDRMQLERDLRRELKLVFDKYEISIPYPQMVVNQPQAEFHHINKFDERRVQKFLEEQREKSKSISEDQGE